MLTKALGKFVMITVGVLFLLPPPAAIAQRRGRTHRRSPAVQHLTVALTAQGYQPVSFNLRRGVPAKVTFIRKVAVTCGTQIVLPDYGIKRDLPLNETVVVQFTPNKAGTFAFACGMGMLKGSIIVR